MGLSRVVYHSSLVKRLGDGVLDFFSGGIRQLTNLHSHIHEGKAFGYIQTIAVLANNGYLNFEIITPSEEPVHLKDVGLWISEGPVTWDILEVPTLTTGVTPIVPKNLNRELLDGAVITSGVVMKSNPTSISGGTSIYGNALQFGINGQGAQSNETIVQNQVERVLRQGEITYLARLQNLSGGNISTSVSLVWYE